MRVPTQITFRHIPHSEALMSKIRERVDHLETLCSYLISCRVVVEMINRRHHQGNLFRLNITLKLPRMEIVSSRDHGKDHAHEDPYVATRDAFNAVERQLEDYIRAHRVRVHYKERLKPERGKVARILRGDGDYGFLITSDGREIYFHKNSVLNHQFDRLTVGSEVRYVESSGEEGPQASTVDLVVIKS